MLRILCIGNPLHGNDGAGQHVFNRLEKITLPKDVEIVDGGTGGMTLLPYFKDCQQVLIVDIARTDEKPGTVLFVENVNHQLAAERATGGEHGGDITTLLSMLPLYLNPIPKVDMMCLSAESVMHFDQSLSPEIAAAIDQLCAEIRQYATRISP